MTDETGIWLGIPNYVARAETLARRLSRVRYCCPGPDPERDHVIESDAGHIEIKREVFNRSEVGLIWEALDRLPRSANAYVVEFTDDRFCLSTEPFSAEKPNVSYAPPGKPAPRKDLRPEWAIKMGHPGNPPTRR